MFVSVVRVVHFVTLFIFGEKCFAIHEARPCSPVAFIKNNFEKFEKIHALVFVVHCNKKMQFVCSFDALRFCVLTQCSCNGCGSLTVHCTKRLKKCS